MSSLPSTSPIVRLVAGVVHAQRLWKGLLFVLVCVVCYLALSPAPPRNVDLGWDKLNHAVAFVALTLSGCFAFPGSRRAVFGVLLGMLALGGLIEIVQYFVPGRSSEWADLGADAIGMAIGAALALSTLKLVRQVAPA
jgi:VanZ family protein